jgi:hypothetical protein
MPPPQHDASPSSDDTVRAVVSDRATIVVVCLGSSSTAGQGQAFGWIDELSRRPQNARFVFKNA